MDPDLNLQLCARVGSASCPRMELVIKIFNRSESAFGKYLLKFMHPNVVAIVFQHDIMSVCVFVYNIIC